MRLAAAALLVAAAAAGDASHAVQTTGPCAVVDTDGLCCNPGALNAGPMLRTANLTLSAAASWCRNTTACVAFTAKEGQSDDEQIGHGTVRRQRHCSSRCLL